MVILKALLGFTLGILLSACVSLPVHKPALESKIFTPEQMRADLKFIDEQLRNIHPEPYSRLDGSDYRKYYKATYDALSWPRNRARFYREVLPFISRYQDSHIQLQIPEEEFQHYLIHQGKFPLLTLLVDNRLVVLDDLQEVPTIPIGAEIRAINGIEIEMLLEDLGRMVSAETDSGRKRLVQMQLAQLLWSYFPDHGQFNILFYWRGKELSEQLATVPQTQLQSQTLGMSSKGSHYGTINIDHRASMLWLNDFNEQHDVFEVFLEDYFKELRETQKRYLILDLRYNQGGITDNLALLLSYLTVEKLSWAESASLKVSRPFKRQHNQLLSDTKAQKYSPYLGWIPMEYLNLWQWEILFASEGDLLETSINPVEANIEKAFDGELIVLSNGYCFSACAAMVASLKSHGRAKVIGESPGSFVDHQFGYPVQVRLPNTGLKLTIPAMKFHLTQGDEVGPILMPDYAVQRRRIDVLIGRDVVFQAALELIKLMDSQ